MKRELLIHSLLATILMIFALACDDDLLTYAPAPTIDALSPATGPASGGTIVRITGNHFPEDAQVLFGERAAQSVLFVSSSELVAMAPEDNNAGPSTLTVRAFTPEGLAVVTESEFEFFNPEDAEAPAPESARMATSRGPLDGGTLTLVTGEDIDDAPSVFLGLHAAKILERSEDALVIEAPAYPQEASVDVTLQNSDGQFSRVSNAFAYYPLDEEVQGPTLTQVTPPSGAVEGGAEVSLIGERLPGIDEGPLVLFGAQVLSGLADGEPGVISGVTTARELGSVAVTLTTADGLSARLDPGFTFVTASAEDDDRLRVLAVIPESGPVEGGQEITIVGIGFQEGATAAIDGQQLPTTFIDENTLESVTPAHPAGLADVSVTLESGARFVFKEGYRYEEESTDPTDPTDPDLEELLLLAAVPSVGRMAGGDPLRLRGVGFEPDAQVIFDGQALETTFIDENTLTITTPATSSPGSVDATVILNDGRSSTLQDAFYYFEFLVQDDFPMLLAALPDTGPLEGGTEVTLVGLGFGEGASVTFGDQPAATTFIDDTTLVATSPAAEQEGFVDVSVTLDDNRRATLAAAFLYDDDFTQPVQIDLVTPAFGVTGLETPIIIQGEGFTPDTEVTIDRRIALDIEFIDSQTLSARAPASDAAGYVDVEVANDAENSATLEDGFAYISPGTEEAPPQIRSVAPTRGPVTGGTRVLIHGAGFDPSARVRFGGSFSPLVEVVSSSTLSAITPQRGPGSVAVSVLNPNGLSASLNPGFTYTFTDGLNDAPTISQTSPDRGPLGGGTRVELSGQHLTGTSVIFLGGQPVEELTVVNDGLLNFQTPAAAQPGPVDLVLTRRDGLGASLEDAFDYRPDAPTVTAITPGRGPTNGGTVARIDGSGFAQGAQVFIGGALANLLAVVDAQTINVETPPGQGLADVTVRNPGDAEGTLDDGFLYGLGQGEAPTIDHLEPNRGPTAGGTLLILRGAHFDSQTAVRFGLNHARRVFFISSEMITVVTPPGAAGVVDVTVTNATGRHATAASAFTYLTQDELDQPPPTLSGISPVSGSTFGGTEITAVGSGFEEDTLFFLDGRPASALRLVNSGLFELTSPPNDEGVVDVVAVNSDGQWAALPDSFTYRVTQCAPTLTPCGDLCFDTRDDPEHCGGCGSQCDPGEICVDSQCACQEGSEPCDGTCVNTNEDSDHCGACGEVCEEGTLCQGGQCVCEPGLTLCDGACSDTELDNDHCGGCGIPCGNAQTCRDGACECSPGLTECGFACVDTARSNEHCGRCDRGCEAGNTCVAGICTPDLECATGFTPPDNGCDLFPLDLLSCGQPSVVSIQEESGTSSPVLDFPLLDVASNELVEMETFFSAPGRCCGGSIADFRFINENGVTLSSNTNNLVDANSTRVAALSTTGSVHECAQPHALRFTHNINSFDYQTTITRSRFNGLYNTGGDTLQSATALQGQLEDGTLCEQVCGDVKSNECGDFNQYYELVIPPLSEAVIEFAITSSRTTNFIMSALRANGDQICQVATGRVGPGSVERFPRRIANNTDAAQTVIITPVMTNPLQWNFVVTTRPL